MFLDSTNYKSQVEALIEKNDKLKIAVAFWGKGAETLLKSKSKKFTVICNLTSGGTNPAVIKTICEWAPRVEIRHHDDLHAKVFVSNTSAIIGSANMSTNGLNIESDEFDGWKEAGYQTHQPADIKAAEKWFDERWNESSVITDAMLEFAEVAWKNRSKNRIRRPGSSLRLLDQTPKQVAGRDIYVMFYKGIASRAAEKFHEKLAENEPKVYSRSGLTYYEDADGAINGHVLIAVSVDTIDTFAEAIAYKVDRVEKTKNGNKITSLHYMEEIEKIRDLSFNKRDAGTFCKRLLKLPPDKITALHQLSPWYVPLEDILTWLQASR